MGAELANIRNMFIIFSKICEPNKVRSIEPGQTARRRRARVAVGKAQAQGKGRRTASKAVLNEPEYISQVASK